MVDTQSHEKLIAVIKGALVAALYAAVTLGLAPLSFGAIQFRLSEVFNNLVMTWSVALELYYVSKLPFWPTYFTVAIGEFGSMLIGAILMWILSKRIDLTR